MMRSDLEQVALHRLLKPLVVRYDHFTPPLTLNVVLPFG
jgi:hypothetical protein